VVSHQAFFSPPKVKRFGVAIEVVNWGSSLYGESGGKFIQYMWEQSSSYARRYQLSSGRAVNRSRLTHGTNTITEDIRSIWFAVIQRQIQ
jgi:hypothetical protein